MLICIFFVQTWRGGGVENKYVCKVCFLERNVIISQVYQQAIDAIPDPGLLTDFGSFHFNRGRTQRAEELYREALAIDPNFLVAKDR